MTTYDAIVLGTGGVGSAALFHLASRGRVLGLDRFHGAHNRGSSHGQTRMIREAYCEHPDYVPLVQRAYQLWKELEQRCGHQLYYEVGLLEIGPADGMVIPGVRRSAEQHRLQIENLSEKDVSGRFPGFRLPENALAVFEQRAGYLLVEQCVSAYLNEAEKLGAERKTEAIIEWKDEGDSVFVRTGRESYSAGRLIITAGAWARELLGELGASLTVLKKLQNWFMTEDLRYRADNGCPAFLFELPQGIYYGFPQLDGRGVKVGEHTGGPEVSDPLNVDRSVDLPQQSRIEQFVGEFLPGVASTASDYSVCMYTMSPDEHFIVDCHPQNRRVCFAAGLSGHGFKFAPALGEALADLALEGKTSLPIKFLGCDRFA